MAIVRADDSVDDARAVAEAGAAEDDDPAAEPKRDIGLALSRRVYTMAHGWIVFAGLRREWLEV